MNDYKEGHNMPPLRANIMFFFLCCAGYYVPKSDGEFYQFCYVTHAGDIRGASTPFQFRSATPTEELLTVTEDDSNSDILVVTTKTGLLEVECTKCYYLFISPVFLIPLVLSHQTAICSVTDYRISTLNREKMRGKCNKLQKTRR